MTIWKEISYEFKRGNNLTRIIFINIGVFVTIFILRLLSWLTTGAQDSILSLVFIENIQTYLHTEYLIKKPWTLFTYMFTHLGFFHLLINLLWLYWMGRIFIDLLNGKRFVAIYILGGLAGALLALIAYNYLPALKPMISAGFSAPMIGASASVMAITAAIGTYVPTYSMYLLFFGKVQLKYIAIAAVILDILFLPEGNAGGRFAHLGGALFGFLWARNMKNGTDISKWFLGIMNMVTSFFSSKPNMKVAYKNQKESASYVPYEEVSKTPTSQSNYSQAEIDAILDKIAKSGYDSLTAKEKETLFSSSKKK